jgi:hypothetical protein
LAEKSNPQPNPTMHHGAASGLAFFLLLTIAIIAIIRFCLTPPNK